MTYVDYSLSPRERDLVVRALEYATNHGEFMDEGEDAEVENLLTQLQGAPEVD
jgi:hypothetical protein